MQNTKRPYTKLGKLIAEYEAVPETFEDDAGEIMYFDPTEGEWLPLVGGR